MKKLLIPALLALLGLGARVGAGVAMKPEPEAETAAACAELAAAVEGGGAGHGAEGEHAAAPCPPAEPDPFAPAPRAGEAGGHGGGHEAERAYVSMDKPFVVPVFEGDKVVAMVVVALSVETDTEAAPAVEGVKPRLRDSFLKAMFRHANSGGFDGSFTSGTKLDDLKSALLAAAKGILPEAAIDEVLVTEIARQDV